MAVETSILPARRVPRVDVANLGLCAVAIVLLAVGVMFVGHRLTTPADGTDVRAPGNPFNSDGVMVRANSGYPGGAPIRAGDRVVELFGRPLDSWAAALLDPVAARPSLGIGDSVAIAVERDGSIVPLTLAAAPFDGPPAIADDWGLVLLALAMAIAGVYLFVRRPHEPAARAMLVLGTAMAASTVPWALGLQVTDLATGTGFWLYVLAAGLVYSVFWSGVLHLALVFPAPYAGVAGGRRLAAVAYGVPLGAQLAFVLAAGLAAGNVLAAITALFDSQAVVQVAVVAGSAALMVRSYWRLPDPTSREQLRWVAVAVTINAIGALLLWFGPQLILGRPLLAPNVVALLGLAFPVALALAINRHHLFQLDTLVNRSLVYGGLTAGVILTYAATVALLGRFIPGNAPFAEALLGAGAVAVVALPLRDRLQRSVSRLMYGDRDDPDGALRRLGRRLEASLDPQTVLPTLVDAVADALRSPYVAVELDRDAEPRIEAAHGTPPIDGGGPRPLVRLPIVYRGRPVGWLVLAPRAAAEPFSRADERLLADLARQAAPTVEAFRLTADLRRSRMALVAAREEERRRLRRDLHDELGPALAGSLMKLGAARLLLATEPGRATGLLDDLETDTRGMIDEIRRIARNLRPPALDELGLAGVLRQQVAAMDGSGTGPRVSLDVPDPFPALPAAVEVAGLRIAIEGLTNAARHSGASHARVCLSTDGEALVVAVTDDGRGIPAGVAPGVGLASMRERAEELGGTLQVLPADGGGTTVIARLPVSPADAA